MRNVQQLVLLGMTTIVLGSCQDVIDIDLRDADRKYVIEGKVVQGVDSVMVRVSRTTSFFETTGPEAITDAEVVLTLPDGSERVLEHGRGNGCWPLAAVASLTCGSPRSRAAPS